MKIKNIIIKIFIYSLSVFFGIFFFSILISKVSFVSKLYVKYKENEFKNIYTNNGIKIKKGFFKEIPFSKLLKENKYLNNYYSLPNFIYLGDKSIAITDPLGIIIFDMKKVKLDIQKNKIFHELIHYNLRINDKKNILLTSFFNIGYKKDIDKLYDYYKNNISDKCSKKKYRLFTKNTYKECYINSVITKSYSKYVKQNVLKSNSLKEEYIARQIELFNVDKKGGIYMKIYKNDPEEIKTYINMLNNFLNKYVMKIYIIYI